MRRQANFNLITTDLSTVYQLTDSDEWFGQAIRDGGVRTGIEERLRTYGKMYVIVGFQTVRDARVSEAAVGHKWRSAGVSAPVGAALASTGALISLGDAIDPSIEPSVHNDATQQRSYVALGEQVIAMQYRRVRFK